MGLAFHPITMQLYVADSFNGAVRIVDADGTTSSIPGLYEAATNVTLTTPTALAFTSDGTLYISDSSRCVIASVTPVGAFSLFVGGGGPPTYSECGTYAAGAIGTSARFDKPYGLAHYNGFLYVSDISINRLIIRVQISTRETITFHVSETMGNMAGYMKGTWMFTNLASDGIGNIFAVSTGFYSTISAMSTQLALDGNDLFLSDGTTQNTSAWVWSYGMYAATPVDGDMSSGGGFQSNRGDIGRWAGLGSLTFDSSGVAYAVDQYSVRAMRPIVYPGKNSGQNGRFTVTTLAGGGATKKVSGNANGIGTNALFGQMTSSATSVDYDVFFGGQNHGGLGIVADLVTPGILYVSDTRNHNVKKITCSVVSCSPTPSSNPSSTTTVTASTTTSRQSSSSFVASRSSSHSPRFSPTVSGSTNSTRSAKQSITESSSSMISKSAAISHSAKEPSDMGTFTQSSTPSVSAESLYATLCSTTSMSNSATAYASRSSSVSTSISSSPRASTSIASSKTFSGSGSFTTSVTRTNSVTRSRSASVRNSASVSSSRTSSPSPLDTFTNLASRTITVSPFPSQDTTICAVCVACQACPAVVVCAAPTSATISPTASCSRSGATTETVTHSQNASSSSDAPIVIAASTSATISPTASFSRSGAATETVTRSQNASSSSDAPIVIAAGLAAAAAYASEESCASAIIARTAVLSVLGGFLLGLCCCGLIGFCLKRRKRKDDTSKVVSVDLPLSLLPHHTKVLYDEEVENEYKAAQRLVSAGRSPAAIQVRDQSSLIVSPVTIRQRLPSLGSPFLSLRATASITPFSSSPFNPSEVEDANDEEDKTAATDAYRRTCGACAMLFDVEEAFQCACVPCGNCDATVCLVCGETTIEGIEAAHAHLRECHTGVVCALGAPQQEAASLAALPLVPPPTAAFSAVIAALSAYAAAGPRARQAVVCTSSALTSLVGMSPKDGLRAISAAESAAAASALTAALNSGADDWAAWRDSSRLHVPCHVCALDAASAAASAIRSLAYNDNPRRASLHAVGAVSATVLGVGVFSKPGCDALPLTCRAATACAGALRNITYSLNRARDTALSLSAVASLCLMLDIHGHDTDAAIAASGALRNLAFGSAERHNMVATAAPALARVLGKYAHEATAADAAAMALRNLACGRFARRDAVVNAGGPAALATALVLHAMHPDPSAAIAAAGGLHNCAAGNKAELAAVAPAARSLVIGLIAASQRSNAFIAIECIYALGLLTAGGFHAVCVNTETIDALENVANVFVRHPGNLAKQAKVLSMQLRMLQPPSLRRPT